MHFYAKLLLKWVYQVSIHFEDVTALEKKYDSVSGVFNNSILVTTAEEKYFFASFVNRDDTLAQIQRLLDNKSAHKTIPMTNLVLKKSTSPGQENATERAAWGEDDEDEHTPSSWTAFPVDTEATRKDINLVQDSRCSSSQDLVSSAPDKMDAHRRSQSVDLCMRSSKDSQISASRRRASLNALSDPKLEMDEAVPSSSVDNQTRESSRHRADTVVAKPDLISPHPPDLGLIEIARSSERSSDLTSFHSTPSGPASAHQSYIVHQTKHIIRTPSPKRSSKTYSPDETEPQNVSVSHLDDVNEPVDDEEGRSDEDSIEEEPVCAPPKRSDHPHPVNCTCHKEHTEMKLMLDHTFDTSVEHLWEILFGSKLQETDFGIRFWGTELKYREIKMTNWKVGTDEVEEPAFTHVERSVPLEEVDQGHHRRLSYVVQSTNSLGPR
jgi:hypothetical protein